MIRGKIDILLISETKIDCTFPKPQFFIEGFSEPHRLDRTAQGGGLLLYLRSDIPAKPLPLIFGNIECIILEVSISKKKWLLLGIYNPNKSQISKHLEILEKSLCHYSSMYDNVLLLGDFNCEIGEESMNDFCSLHHLQSLIKVPTCYKSTTRPSCIDLILTNRPKCFQNSMVLETGLSDFHLLTLSILKTTFRKGPPKVIKYRDYKRYLPLNFQNELKFRLNGIDLTQISNDEYVSLLMEMLNRHAPLKTKYVRANDQPFMTKQLRREHMKRSRLRNKYRKDRNEVNRIAYTKQRNVCVNLLKKTKISYYEHLQPSNISDNKKFWRTVKPLFSEKAISSEKIILIENNVIISEDQEVAETFNSFFSNAVKNLNIDYYEHFSFDEYFLCNDTKNEDPVRTAIEKYEKHPSIMKIRNLTPRNVGFSFKPTDMKTVVREISNLKESTCTPIESIPVKIHYKYIKKTIMMF